jgi:ribosomal protein L11 methyltransferase
MSNSWWEITINCIPSLEEDLFWRLSEFGCKGMAVTKSNEDRLTIAAYVPQIQVTSAQITNFFLELDLDAIEKEIAAPISTYRQIEEEDWSSSWKQHWHSQPIGDKLLIHPAWLDIPPDSDRLLLKLDPGVAFGTGTHATTQLCLEALEMRILPGKDIVIADIGCGSGILSTAALLLGASRVYAVDNDPLAVKATAENRELNQIEADRLLVELGTVEQLQMMLPGPVDGVVCNILAEPIMEIAPYLAAVVKPKGWCTLSGIISAQVPDISAKMEKHGWVVGTVWRRDDWSCINLKRGK